MNREIKFRAYDTLSKDMYPNIQNHINDEVFAFGYMIKNERFKIMQYTGLKDKNGVEIYEGDINENRDILSYADALCRYGWTDGGYIIDINTSTDKVIGNIYKNPELL